jgi:hypothetical protein
MRRALVIVRAGDTSLHEGWLAGPEDRTWDLLVSYFGDDPQRFRGEDVRRIDAKGPKWPALHALVRELADEIGAYDYVWLPDDDLACDKETINRLFAMCREHRLELAQPALSPTSHLGHAITLRNRSFRLRFTNFVEVMAPCFSADFLRRCAPSFGENISGWGLDYLWPSWASDAGRVAIIDAAIIRHTRPVGGPNYRVLTERGITARDELLQLAAKYGIRAAARFVTGGITLDGRHLSASDGSHPALVAELIAGYLPELGGNAPELLRLIEPSLALLPPAVWVPEQYHAAPAPPGPTAL